MRECALSERERLPPRLDLRAVCVMPGSATSVHRRTARTWTVSRSRHRSDSRWDDDLTRPPRRAGRSPHRHLGRTVDTGQLQRATRRATARVGADAIRLPLGVCFTEPDEAPGATGRVGSRTDQLGLRRSEAMSLSRECPWPRIGPATYAAAVTEPAAALPWSLQWLGRTMRIA